MSSLEMWGPKLCLVQFTQNPVLNRPKTTCHPSPPPSPPPPTINFSQSYLKPNKRSEIANWCDYCYQIPVEALVSLLPQISSFRPASPTVYSYLTSRQRVCWNMRMMFIQVSIEIRPVVTGFKHADEHTNSVCSLCVPFIDIDQKLLLTTTNQ
jgi:hypothetical protein